MCNIYKIKTWTDEFGENQLNLDKLKEYLEFIQKAEQSRDPERYSEWHHVMPKCIDKDKKYINEVVCINGADHLRAHMKLVKSFTEESYYRQLLSYPLNQMKSSLRLEGLSPDEYEESRKLFSNSQRGSNNPACRDEVRFKISQSHKGKIRITDGIHERCVKSQDEIPDGWYLGQSVAHNQNSGKGQLGHKFSEESRHKMSQSRSKGNKGRKWITNEIINSTIKPDEEIPDGWRLGRVVSSETKLRISNVSSGRIKINNGEVSKYIRKGDEIPEGYVLGGLSSKTKGKIRITDGYSNKCINPEDPIPLGWRRGMTTIRSRNKNDEV